MLIALLICHILIKRAWLDLHLLPLLLTAPMSMLAYQNLPYVNATEGFQEAFAFFVFVILFSSYSTHFQIQMTQALRARNRHRS